MARRDIRLSRKDRNGFFAKAYGAHRTLRWVAMIALGALGGCSSVGNVGLITLPSSDPGALLKEQHSYTEVGPVTGQACRYFLLAIIPWGDSSPSTAVEEALASSEGDAIINASIETSLYGFIPIYNVFSFTCTTVKGVAIKFTESPSQTGSISKSGARAETGGGSQ